MVESLGCSIEEGHLEATKPGCLVLACPGKSTPPPGSATFVTKTKPPPAGEPFAARWRAFSRSVWRSKNQEVTCFIILRSSLPSRGQVQSAAHLPHVELVFMYEPRRLVQRLGIGQRHEINSECSDARFAEEGGRDTPVLKRSNCRAAATVVASLSYPRPETLLLPVQSGPCAL